MSMIYHFIVIAFNGSTFETTCMIEYIYLIDGLNT